MQAFEEEMAHLLGFRRQTVYKHQLGQALIIGGNLGMAGACMLASRACVYSGAGLTRVLTHPYHVEVLHGYLPEALAHRWDREEVVSDWLASADTILIGPGLGRDGRAHDLLRQVFHQARPDQTLILDADGLNLWAQDPLKTQAPLVMTPHEGEWQRLVAGQAQQEPSSWAQAMGIYLVKKGHQTVLYSPDGSVHSNIPGNPGMAIGGMGDCLAGMITGIMGQTQEVLAGCRVAAYLHTKIANQIFQHDLTVLPSRLIEAIPSAMKDLTRPLIEGGVSQ